jgi:hypothetical protein
MLSSFPANVKTLLYYQRFSVRSLQQNNRRLCDLFQDNHLLKTFRVCSRENTMRFRVVIVSVEGVVFPIYLPAVM